MTLLVQVAVVAAVFAAVTGVALLLGAAGLGTAFGIAQVAAVATIAYLLLRR